MVGWVAVTDPDLWLALTPLHVAIDLVFVADVAVATRRAYWHDGMAVFDPYRIVLRYARTELPVDAIAAVRAQRPSLDLT
jgi:hypothetical protein